MKTRCLKPEFQIGCNITLHSNTHLRSNLGYTIFSALVFLLSLGSTTGQDVAGEYVFKNDSTYLIELHDGTQLIGSFIEKDSAHVSFRTSSLPKIDIPFQSIRKIERLDPGNIVAGTYWFPNPHATRYLFAPSAYNLKKGEAYYQNTYLFLNSFNIGVSDHFSIGGGLELISTFSEGNPLFYITPKVGFKVSEKWNIGGGLLYASIPDTYASGRTSLGTLYGVATRGTVDKNITAGLGWGFVSGEFEGKPMVTISGITRIAKKTALLSENWFVPGDGYTGIYSYGIRFFGDKLAVDLAFINNREIIQDIVIGIPYVDFVVKF